MTIIGKRIVFYRNSGRKYYGIILDRVLVKDNAFSDHATHSYLVHTYAELKDETDVLPEIEISEAWDDLILLPCNSVNKIFRG